MDEIRLVPYNAVFHRVECERGIAEEIKEQFTFFAPNYKFNPKFKFGIWDGRISLFLPSRKLLYVGLTDRLKKFCQEQNYTLHLPPKNQINFDLPKEIVSYNIPVGYQPRDYQTEGFRIGIDNDRGIFLLPTGGGKSLLIYLLARYYLNKTGKKFLVILPNIGLIKQLRDDFTINYGFDPKNVHEIYSGQERETSAQIVLTTWQTAHKLDPRWFDQFGAMVGDEAHTFTAKSLIKIMNNLENCPYRFGTTGTLNGEKVHQLVLESLFGPVFRLRSTTELMEEGYLSNLNIKFLVLKYPETVCKSLKSAMSKIPDRRKRYQLELDYILSNERRNRFIQNLALSLKGTTLVLFQYVDKHGKVLYENMKNQSPSRDIYYVSGEVDGETRNDIRKIVETKKDPIIIASSVFQTGTDIKSVQNIIFTSPTKAKIKVLQSIGRGLRTMEGKMECTLYDIVDDLSYKKHQNYCMKHYFERVGIYAEEGFDYQSHKINFQTD